MKLCGMWSAFQRIPGDIFTMTYLRSITPAAVAVSFSSFSLSYQGKATSFLFSFGPKFSCIFLLNFLIGYDRG